MSKVNNEESENKTLVDYLLEIGKGVDSRGGDPVTGTYFCLFLCVVFAEKIKNSFFLTSE